MAILSKTLDDVFSAMPTGSLDRAILNNLRGINHRQTPGAVPINKDMPGYTFFTRPQLNMQKDNVRNVRQLASLLSDNPVSIQTYIRAMLDPRLMAGVSFSSPNGPAETPIISCPIVDNLNAFIPPLTNNIVSISGWPSISVPTNTSKAGLYNESQTIIDGRVINSETFDITVNFRNTRGDPILYLFYVWALYGSMVFEGKLVPYLDFISENEIDYNTRIYRIVTDYTKTKVTKLACCNAAIPVGVPVGDAFDIPGDKPYVEANREISMRFKCDGVRYFDDLVAKDFNDTVAIFNPAMIDGNREDMMVKLSPKIATTFNFLGYPRINTITAELEWWVPVDVFNRVVSKYLNGIQETNSENYEGD